MSTDRTVPARCARGDARVTVGGSAAQAGAPVVALTGTGLTA